VNATAQHPNVTDALWPSSSPAGRFARLVQTAFPTWVWIVNVRHCRDPFGGLWLGPMLDRAVADDLAAAIEQLRMPGLAHISVERKDGAAMPQEFADDTDWRESVRVLRDAKHVHRVAWLIDYLMAGHR
jgi:hypothetical protein